MEGRELVFGLVAGMLVVWAVVLAVAGIRDPRGFPPRAAPAYVVSAVLVLLTMGAAVSIGGQDEPEAAAEAGGGAAAGREVFTSVAQPTCASCHVLADAGSTGTTGPNLDDTRPTAELVEQRVREGQGAMPSYAGRLDDGRIEAVASYVASATR